MKNADFLEFDGQEIFRFINIPEGDGKFPVIMMLHGFTGNNMESKFYFSKLSKILAENGIASVRFDFRGSGNSDGCFEEMTVDTETEDALCVLNDIVSDDRFDKTRIGVLGFSMGGMVAMRILGKKNESLKCGVLWSPASSPAILGQKVFTLSKNISATDGIRDYQGFKLGKEFFKVLETINPIKEFGEFKDNVMIIHGTADASVECELSENIDREFENVIFRPVEGADHTYSSIDYGEYLISETLKFFKNNL